MHLHLGRAGPARASAGDMALVPTCLEVPPKTRTTADEVSGLWRAPRIDDGTSAPHVETLWRAAARADARSSPLSDLAGVWQDLMDGRLTVSGEGRSSRRRYVLVRTNVDARERRGALSRIETSVLVRVLCGEQQKLVAVELEIACSTASKWYTHALAKLRLAEGPFPLPLVIAAQSWASGVVSSAGARSASFEHGGDHFTLFCVPNPRLASETRLTHAEQEVAELLIEGGSRWEIASHRCTSTQTVACQLRGIFSKLRLTGRHALIARAVDQGWIAERE
jgi:DNA-binding NarL/FixJ family response regulator